MKVYRTRGWARRACGRVKWHTVEEVARGFVVRPMTMNEKARSQEWRDLQRMIADAMQSEIERMLQSPCAMYDVLKKRSPK